MSAPIGNEFWRRRERHGRPMIYETPEELLKDCEDYFQETDSRKWVKKDWVGKDAIEVERETSTPYTLSGLYIHLGIDRKTWDLYRDREDFIPVVTRVEQIIFTQKFEGAAVGAYNANIIARDLGLADKKDAKTEGQVEVTVKYEDRGKATGPTP